MNLKDKYSKIELETFYIITINVRNAELATNQLLYRFLTLIEMLYSAYARKPK